MSNCLFGGGLHRDAYLDLLCETTHMLPKSIHVLFSPGVKRMDLPGRLKYEISLSSSSQIAGTQARR